MVWRISSKQKQPSKEEIQSTAMIGLAVVIGLGIIAWAVQHLQYIGQNMSKTFKEFAEACWDSHKQVGTKMKGGKRVPNCVPKNEEQEIEEVSAAMRALRRRNAKNARTQNTIAKYGQAAKMGIPASQVNQRRTAVTRKKI